MFADSSGKFQVKVRFNRSNGREKGYVQLSHISELFSGDAVDKVFISREILIRSHSGSKRKALP